MAKSTVTPKPFRIDIRYYKNPATGSRRLCPLRNFLQRDNYETEAPSWNG